jgi:hypothetical protein
MSAKCCVRVVIYWFFGLLAAYFETIVWSDAPHGIDGAIVAWLARLFLTSLFVVLAIVIWMSTDDIEDEPAAGEEEEKEKS